MKTAMQELKESIDIECKSRGLFINWDMYLAKERQQIENANIAGMEFIPVDPSRYNEDAEDYYNKTYSHD